MCLSLIHIYDLTDREREVLRLRFGLEDGHAHSLVEVGRRFGVTRERIRPVSYTHLDVYKRQAERSARLWRNRPTVSFTQNES